MTQRQGRPQPPLVLSVVAGQPTPDELAALLVVLASRQPARRAGADQRPSLWSWPGGALRVPVVPGPGAWRASGLPR